jgi:hypothetical protein
LTRARPATVRYYFDADVRGLGKLVAQVRSDCTYPGDPGGEVHKRARPACIIDDPSTIDTEWIPRVAGKGWLIITRDTRIQDHRLEIQAVIDNEARMLEGRPGPFIYNANKSGLSAVKLT